MNCPFCQNHRIAKPEILSPLTRELTPYELVQNVLDLGLNSVAFTYNEPTLQAKFICYAATVLQENDIAIVLVTNGAMSNKAVSEFISCLGSTGAVNIDIKAFSDETYNILGGNLKAVKNNIEGFIQTGIHIELTHLVVPGFNDTMKELYNALETILNETDYRGKVRK